MHSICSIQSHILKFQPFLTSFVLLFNLKYFKMSQIGNSTGSSWNIVQSSLKVRYSDLVGFSDQFSYINLFHIIYGLKDMNFRTFSNFQRILCRVFKGPFAVCHTRQRSLCRVPGHGKGFAVCKILEITKTLEIHIF